MFEESLFRAVERFASKLQSVPDADLERKWTWGAYDEGIRFAFFRSYEELRELAVKVAAERAVAGPQISSAQRILAQYHLAFRDLQAALLGIGEDAAGQAPAEGEWSLKQVVAHIVDADSGFLVGVKYALDRNRRGEAPAVPSEETWVSVLGEEGPFQAVLEGPLAGIQAYHNELHQRVLREFSGISEDELNAPALYWEGYELPLRFRLHRFDSHLRQHTIQIDKTLAGIGHPPNEAKRLLRLIYAALAEVEGLTIGAREAGSALVPDAAKTIAARADEISGLL
jgi:hypothetical protein